MSNFQMIRKCINSGESAGVRYIHARLLQLKWANIKETTSKSICLYIVQLLWFNISVDPAYTWDTNLVINMPRDALAPNGAMSSAGILIMMTSSNGNIFRVTGHLCGEFTGPGEFPTQRPVTRGFDVFFDLRLNKRLSKQSWGWWLETLSCSLWRQSNVSEIPSSYREI